MYSWGRLSGEKKERKKILPLLYRLSTNETSLLQGKKFPTCLAVQVLICISQLLAFFLFPLAGNVEELIFPSIAFYEIQTKLTGKSVTQKSFLPGRKLSTLGADKATEAGWGRSEGIQGSDLTTSWAIFFSPPRLIFLAYKMGTPCFLGAMFYPFWGRLTLSSGIIHASALTDVCKLFLLQEGWVLKLEWLPASWLLMLFSSKAAAEVAQEILTTMTTTMILAWIGFRDTPIPVLGSDCAQSISCFLPALYTADLDEEQALRFWA